MADAMMESLGEANGVKWYWAEPGRFERPGVYYWDGTSNVLCVPYPAKPEAPAQAGPLEKLTRLQEEMGLYDEAPAQAELTGCSCRWDKDDNRVQTCARHQGWLDVVHEWAARAKDAEWKLTLALEAPAQADDGKVVVMWNHDRTRILAVTRQNTEGQILKVIAEAPAQAEVDLTPTEFCWLVEHFIGDGTGNSTGHYHTGFTDIGGNSRMTKDPYKAKRFATWREANLAAMKLGHTLSGTWRAVQHGFAARIPEVPPQGAQSAGEVERGDVVAFEFYNRATGHAIVDYSVNTHVGNLTADKGYEARPLVYAAPRQNVLDGSKPIPAWQAREALDELEAAARGDAPFNHQAAAVVRAALSHKEPKR